MIGTQLVAKGHHFPKLNLVGIVDADLGLTNGDPRAAERTFQLLHQVVGRAGRDAGIGRGYLQTHQPEHPVMRALIAQDRDAFYDAEIAMRESAHYPPFGRLASLVVSGPDGTTRKATRGRWRAPRRTLDEVRVLGPADAPLSLVRGRHRLRLWSKRRATSICRLICATGSPTRRSRKARSSSTSTSIRRVFCDSRSVD